MAERLKAPDLKSGNGLVLFMGSNPIPTAYYFYRGARAEVARAEACGTPQIRERFGDLGLVSARGVAQLCEKSGPRVQKVSGAIFRVRKNDAYAR